MPDHRIYCYIPPMLRRFSPTRALFCGVMLSGLVGCVADDPVTSRSEEIINGSRETAQPSVVAVLNLGRTGAGGLCSGTVISPYAVLTAKHCVYRDDGSAVATVDLGVAVGHDVINEGGITQFAGVIDVRAPGSGWDPDRDLSNGTDIAVLITDAPLSPGAIGVAPTRPSVGATARITGFGRTNPDTSVESSGLKYTGTTQIAEVGANLIRTSGSSWTCQGDSGGPLFVDGRIVGVTSFGIGGCGFRSAHFFTSVAPHISWIGEAQSYRPPCTPSTEVCNGIDDDCNGEVDEVACSNLGDDCTTDSQCRTESCQTVDGRRQCVTACDPADPIPRCAIGWRCDPTGCGTGRCVPSAAGSLPEGASCSDSAQCASQQCTEVNGALRCARQCRIEEDPCLDDTVCDDSTGCALCTPIAESSRPRPFTSVCDDNSQCASGDCELDMGDAFCSRACTGHDDCSSGGAFRCRAGRCVRGLPAQPGETCESSDDCVRGECAQVESDNLCVLPCEEGCPAPLVCGETSAGMRCAPPGLSLGETCGDNSECRSGICAGTCTVLCDDTPCPSGFDCVPAGAVSGCFPASEGGGDGGMGMDTDEGGCSTSGTPTGHLAWMLALVAISRRRRNP